MPKRWNTPSQQDRANIAELYKSGHSISQTCEASGFSPGTVRKVLIELGIPRRNSDARNRVGADVRAPGVQPVIIKRTLPGGERLEPVGNCVRCRRRIPHGGQFTRVPGVLGKVCPDCVQESERARPSGDEQGAAGDQRARTPA